MANKWNIPEAMEKDIRARDRKCVYCGVEFTAPKEELRTAASWEHIINDVTMITKDNIALCCCGCNASKGKKKLSEWLKSEYCTSRGITFETVAPIVKKALCKGS